MRKKLYKYSMVLLLLTVLTAPGLFAQEAVVKEVPKPTSVLLMKPEMPQPEMVWNPGDWKWNAKSKKYDWKKGDWMKDKKGSSWKKGHWKEVKGGFTWVAGHWLKD